MYTCRRVCFLMCALGLGLLASLPVLPAAAGPPAEDGIARAAPAPLVCEDFARRQTGLADRLLRQSNYTRAIKVLNSTLENCERDFVREKLYEVLSEWYSVARQRSSTFQQFVDVLSNQQYLTSSQRARLDRRVQSHVKGLIRERYDAGSYQSAYELCRQYPDARDSSFSLQYYCGTSAEEIGAEGVAMNAYAALLEDWSSDQSLTNWDALAGKLESMYFLNGRFRDAYGLARQMAVRDPTPKAIISSLVSVRANFLAPVMKVGAHFYENSPIDAALAHVDKQMQTVNFPKYVKAFYVLGPDGTVQRGMYGSEANQPSASRLAQASGSVSLLQGSDGSNLAWLVSPLGSRYLVMEFGIATTPEENVRLENVQDQVRSDKQWRQLYRLEFKETYPASGSAVGTLMIASRMSEMNFRAYDAIFEDSPVLNYYCIQNASEEIEASYNFNRSDLGYGDSIWDKTSGTPALYHHKIQYGGRSMREVVWPQFINEQWTGVVRVGLVQS
jgi:tetratricopeptide (TPR) repeat protein